MKVLFICNQGENRSKTAKELFGNKFETKSAGLYSEKVISEKEVSWADVIVVMEDIQRKEIAKRFPKLYMKKKILSLNIPDVYYYKQAELVDILKSKVDELF